jgi:uncharacterized protein YjbI with pentapeptide repeats
LLVIILGGLAAAGAFALAYRLTGGPTFKPRFEVGLKAATAVAAVTAGALTWARLEVSRRDHHLGTEDRRLARDRDLTERYSKAVDQIGSPNPLVRVGGILTLERFALDAAAQGGRSDNDWRMALDLLAAAARTHGRTVPPSNDGEAETDATGPSPSGGDITAIEAVRALGRFRSRSGIDHDMEYDLGGIDLTDADLRGAQLPSCVLTEANLTRVNLFSANLSGAVLTSATLRGAGLVVADLTRADLTLADLNDADLSSATLRDATLREATMTGAQLKGTDLVAAVLNEASFSGASLQGASLERAELEDTDGPGADLNSANLCGAHLRRSNLEGCDLSSACLADADLLLANMRGGIMDFCDLEGTDLTGADLTGASFSKAKLRRAKLEGADLTQAMLVSADLSGADLTDADLSDAILVGLSDSIHYDARTVWPAGFSPPESAEAITM